MSESNVVNPPERGVGAEAEAKAQLKASYRLFVEEADAATKNDAGRTLIRSIFGKKSLAVTPIA